MKTFYFKAENQNKTINHIIQANDSTEARHWVINHLDLSENWTVTEVN